MALICLPLFVYFYAHAEESTRRIKMVAALELSEIKANVELWARALFQRGDLNAEFKLPGRPILDPALGLLFLVGLAVLPLKRNGRWFGPWIIGLIFFSMLPSLLSKEAPYFLRASGLGYQLLCCLA